MTDGGGTIFRSGGEYEFGATIGQCDAGPATGGAYELSGGFWFPVSAGDGNGDGVINLLDYDAFEASAGGPNSEPPAGDCQGFDLDASGTVDLGDFAMLQAGCTGP